VPLSGDTAVAVGHVEIYRLAVSQPFHLRYWCLLLTAFASVGCTSDECTAGRSGCDGNIAQNCVSLSDGGSDSYTVWNFDACDDALCMPAPEGLSEAFCVLDTAPDPECPEDLKELREASRCVDGRVVLWRHGYRTRDYYCPEDATCVDFQSEGFDSSCTSVAFCSRSPAPEPLCQPGVDTACAEDAAIFDCECGFSRDVHACNSAGQTCAYANLGENRPPQGVCR
jgi:hypothetical protein